MMLKGDTKVLEDRGEWQLKRKGGGAAKKECGNKDRMRTRGKVDCSQV